MIKTIGILLASAAIAVTAITAQTPTAAPAPAPSGKSAAGIAVDPMALIKKATLAVPANAGTATAAGKGALEVNTSNAADDTDSYWVDKVDVDGNGNVDEAAMVWDDEDKVLYAYSDATFTCKNGETGNGGMLVAVNAAGNPRNRPAGSGFWAAELDKSECGSQTAGIIGCRFDASGKSTACGTVTLDAKNDDIVIVTASK